jgi:hypothetical protein
MADETRTLVVQFKGVTTDLGRATRRVSSDVTRVGRDVEVAGGRIERGLNAGLATFLDNDVAGAVAGAVGKIPAPMLAASGAVAALGLAAAGTTAAGLALGGALGVVGAWLYRSDPTSPMAQAVDEVRGKWGELATTVRDQIQPAFDDIANAIGPVLVDLITRAKDAVVNNGAEIRDTIVEMAAFFLDATVVATYFGQGLILVSTGALLILVNSLGLATMAFGALITAMGWISGNDGMKQAGRDFIQTGKDAMAMSDDIVEGAKGGVDALTGVRDGARTAKGSLEDITGKGWTVNIKANWAAYDAGAAIRNQGGRRPTAVGVPGAGRSLSDSGGGATTVNVTVSGVSDPHAVARAIRGVLRGDAQRLGRQELVW